MFLKQICTNIWCQTITNIHFTSQEIMFSLSILQYIYYWLAVRMALFYSSKITGACSFAQWQRVLQQKQVYGALNMTVGFHAPIYTNSEFLRKTWVIWIHNMEDKSYIFIEHAQPLGPGLQEMVNNYVFLFSACMPLSYLKQASHLLFSVVIARQTDSLVPDSYLAVLYWYYRYMSMFTCILR